MTLTAFRDTVQIGGPIVPSALAPFNFPVAAATTIFAGDVVCTDASGNAVPLSASTALKAWGRCEKTVDNSAGLAGAKTVDALPGVFALTNGAGGDAITAAHVGRIAFGSADATANLTDGAGLRPALGKIYGLHGSQVKVGIGEPSLYDDVEEDETSDGNPLRVKTAVVRNIVNGDVADLAAYTVASNAAVNDATLNVEGDFVLLVAQATPAQNGLYRVGVVAAGVAPLTRVSPMPLGYVCLAEEFEIYVRSGTVFAHTKWFNSAGVTIGTTSPAFFPESVTITQALVAGTFTIASVPILSATKTGVSLTRSIANTCTLTDGGYVCNGNPTPGALGTASLPIMASVLAGTINVADISTLHVTITNR